MDDSGRPLSHTCIIGAAFGVADFLFSGANHTERRGAWHSSHKLAYEASKFNVGRLPGTTKWIIWRGELSSVTIAKY
jgi:hypothetical protein